MTPVVGRVPEAPVPFAGSDGMTHLVYELFVTNASSAPVTLTSLEVLSAGTNEPIETLDEADLADRFTLAYGRPAGGVLDAAQTGVVYIHLAVEPDSVPRGLRHDLSIALAPEARNPTGGTGGTLDIQYRPVAVSDQAVPLLGPPLRGSGYVAADGCCDSTRHVRALLPVNGTQSIAQRFAIDWEQIDGENKIFSGPAEDLSSYVIYGAEAIAVADGTVVRVIDGLPEQTPGVAPDGISLEDADGNAVILDLGDGVFVMYAHLQPGSPRVSLGDEVNKGDPLGLVGNSGNSIAPHLHLHVMDSPLSLAASGLPYAIDSFTITGRSVSTEAFDRAEAEGTPLEMYVEDPPSSHNDQYPMDQSIVTF